MKKGILIVAALLWATDLKAEEPAQTFSEVVSVNLKEKVIRVTHDNSSRWTLDDSVCITRDKKDIACGIVIATDNELATVQILSQSENVSTDNASDSAGDYVQLTFEFPNPQKGDSVRLIDKSPSIGIREIASELKAEKEFGGKQIITNVYDHLTLQPPFMPESNLSGGVNLIFPTLEYQQTISDYSAIGVMPIFMNYSVGDGAVKGTGCFVNYHHYSDGNLNGYWVKAGLGLYGLSYSYQSAEDSGIAPAISASFGKRIFKNENLNFGFGAGAQYIFAKTNTGLSFGGFIPSIIVDVGFAF